MHVCVPVFQYASMFTSFLLVLSGFLAQVKDEHVSNSLQHFDPEQDIFITTIQLAVNGCHGCH